MRTQVLHLPVQPRQLACDTRGQAQGFQRVKPGQGALGVGIAGSDVSIVNTQGAKTGLRPKQGNGDFGQLEIVIQVRVCGNQRRQHDALAIGPGGVAFFQFQATPGKAADEVAQNGRDILEQCAGGIVLVLVCIKAVDLLHDPERVLQAGAIEYVAGMHGPGFEQASFHAGQQGGGATAELPGKRDVGGGDAAYPAEDEVLLVACQHGEFGGELLDLEIGEFGFQPDMEVGLHLGRGKRRQRHD